MKKILCIMIILLFAGWLSVCVVDLVRVNHFEKPLFCIAAETSDDGGSGKYTGCFYSFDIKGNFMPEEKLPGITSFRAYIFGIEVLSGVRD